MGNRAISTKPLSGYMELLPAQQRVFNNMLDCIRQVYQENGFIAMDQPVIDRTESLLAHVGGDTSKELIRIIRHDEKEMALRFDLTVPLARYVANNYGQLTFPFRRYAIGKVYRGERPQAGRFREFYQCDVDIIGNETLSVRYDADIVLLMARVLSRLEIGRFEIRINNRKLMNGLFEHLEITNTKEILRILDKQEKISPKEMIDLLEEAGLKKTQIDSLLEFNQTTDTRALPSINNVLYQTGLSELQSVLKVTTDSPIDSQIFVWDPSIARGLDYYTGTVFETRLIDNPDIGSVCSGGRYDSLASAYTNRSLPGVGTSIGLSRLFDQLMKKEIITPSLQHTDSQALIVPLDESQTAQALHLRESFLQSNLACEISFTESKLDKRIKYADKLGIPYVVLIGENEVSSGRYTLHNMADGNEEALSPDEIINRLAS